MISGRGSNLGALIAAAMKPDYPAQIVAVFSDKADAVGLERAASFDIPGHAIARKDFESREAHEAAMMEAVAEDRMRWRTGGTNAS